MIPSRLSFLLLLGVPAAAHAAEPTPDLADGAAQLVLGLAIVIGLLLATLWLIKRLSTPRGAAAGLKVLGAVPVGPRERVVLVEVADKVLVLGVSPGSVRSLDTVPASALAVPAGADNGEARKPDFATWLKRSMERRDHGA